MKVLPPEDRPLAGIVVVDFSQFLSGPLAGLKLADLGARVIKIERPGIGDLCRTLYLSDTDIGGDSSLFHAINRNKESFAANLSTEEDRARVLALLDRADVMIQNFRPGVIERLGFGPDVVRARNPRLVYGSITGYGDRGPWRDLPGQDLIAQARSGLLWLTGRRDDPPTAMGLAVADMLAGKALAQGILAALVGRNKTGKGRVVETSLLEALLDFQFEVLTTHLNDGGRRPVRPAKVGAHAYLGAPYGIYETADGYLAIAMTPSLERLAGLMRIDGLDRYYGDPQALIDHRDAINAAIAEYVKKRTTKDWLSVLQPADVWCAEVVDWPTLLQSEAFEVLEMRQEIARAAELKLSMLRGPLRFDGHKLTSPKAAPALGEHTHTIIDEFALDAGKGADGGPVRTNAP